MSSTCFEPEGSSSGKRLYLQVWYYNIPVRTTVFLMMNPRFRNM